MRDMPTTLQSSASKPVESSRNRAGISFREVRSPEAPKMMMVGTDIGFTQKRFYHGSHGLSRIIHQWILIRVTREIRGCHSCLDEVALPNRLLYC